MDGDVSSDPMEGVENKEQSTPINVDVDEQPTPQNHIPSENAEMHAGEEEIVMKRKRKKTSKAWYGFTIVTLSNGTKKAQCIHCKTKLTYGDSGTTSTLKRHLAICKPHKDYEEKQNLLNFPLIKFDGDAGHEKLPSLIRPDAKYDGNKMREAIATWVLGTEQPFSVVEDDLFVHMMKTATPLFEKTNRTSTKADCFKIYEHEKKTLKALTKAASKISLTTDCWKSSHQKIEYMVITGHFIDHNWRLQKRVLSFVHVPPPRTGLDIADGIYKCLKHWEIEDKIFTISVDNAAYNDRALRRLKEIFSRVRKLTCGGRLFHVRCCAHILNLLVKDGLAMIDSVIREVREGIKYINNSEARLQTFSNIAHQLQIQDRKLLLDVPTRWNSTYDMLSVALKFKDVFPRFAEYEPHFHHLPNDEEWVHVESVCTNVISGSDYPTSNLYLIEVFRVKETLDKGSLSKNDFIKTMVTKMKEKFDKYWGECHLVMAIASVLDPRFKMKLVEFSFPTIYSNAEKNIEEVKKALYEMYEEYLEIHDASVREAATPANGCGGNEVSKTSLGSGWEAFGEFIKNTDLERPEKSELDMYLEEGVYRDPRQKGMDSFKALEWWNVHKLKYRVLSKMVMDVLAIPISTVASEATFSAGKEEMPIEVLLPTGTNFAGLNLL
ncbi:zinc finger BED domain-containing protein RICESLEEPER 2-like [Lactuca sativa]|uniref:zinc finger BED domain-containing protein RICESLEEPER 2-like n=1 Tax=Lactuca sativa TaxID=4236 RepID=UPI0022AFDF46|nr:zinc finger BED domain-containing protein RICESLEEPER 2-like [Lactuca sativa]